MINESKYHKEHKCTVTEVIENGKFHISFVYDDGNKIEYKFKDPRDTLHFITKNWKNLETIELLRLFDIVQYGSILRIYTVMDFYYMLMLEVIITFLELTPKPVYDVNDNMTDPTKVVISSYNNTGLKIYNQKLQKTLHYANLFAISNTWRIYQQKNYDGIPKPEEIGFPIDFNFNVKDTDILFKTEFNQYRNLSKYNFKDGYYLVYTSIWEGIYYKVGDFNSCKIKIKTII